MILLYSFFRSISFDNSSLFIGIIITLSVYLSLSEEDWSGTDDIAFHMLMVLKSKESAIKNVVTSLLVELYSSIFKLTECLRTGSHSPRFWLLAFISVASSIMTCFSS